MDGVWKILANTGFEQSVLCHFEIVRISLTATTILATEVFIRRYLRGRTGMVRTLDFVFILQRDKKMRNRIYELMDSSCDEEINIRGWHLFFDQKRRWVVVTDNGLDESLKYKFIPAEIEYDSLIYLMDPVKNKEEIKFQMNYLEDF